MIKLCSCVICFCLCACDPVTLVLGGGALVGTNSIRNERGATGAMSDTELQSRINGVLFKKDSDIFDRVEFAIKHGIVVVAGYMKDHEQRDKAIRIIQSIEGPVQVGIELEIGNLPTAGQVISDTAITSKIKGIMKFDSEIHSLNYEVTTVKNIVFICGTAQSATERDRVLHHARSTSGVKKVVSYVKLKKKIAN